SSSRRHTRCYRDWSSDVCSSDLGELLPRTRSLGARACELRGWRADGLAVSRDAVVGKVGQGFEIAAQAYQVTRAVLPGMALGSEIGRASCRGEVSREEVVRTAYS